MINRIPTRTDRNLLDLRMFCLLLIATLACATVQAFAEAIECRELIRNGEFESVDTVNCMPVGFQSDLPLQCQPPYRNTPEGLLSVLERPIIWNPEFLASGRQGKMLVCDPRWSGLRIWFDTIDVVAGATYRFSGWFTKLNMNSYAGPEVLVRVRGSIDTIILPRTSLETPGQWRQLSGTYRAIRTERVVLSIEQAGVTLLGHDLGLDGLSLLGPPAPPLISVILGECPGDTNVIEVAPEWSSRITWRDPDGRQGTGAQWKTWPLESVVISYVVDEGSACRYEGTVSVNIKSALVLDVPVSISACQGSTFSAVASSNGHVEWFSEDGQLLGQGDTLIALATRKQRLLVRATRGDSSRPGLARCVATAFVELDLLPPAELTLPDTLEFCAGDTVRLQLPDSLHYRWSAGSGFDTSNVNHPLFFPTQTTQFNLIARNATGCEARHVLTLVPTSGRIQRSIVLTADSSVVPGVLSDVHIEIPAGLDTVAVELRFDPTIFGRFGEPTNLGGWTVRSSEIQPGRLQIVGSGSPTGVKLTQPLEVFLPQDRRLSEILTLHILDFEISACDTVSSNSDTVDISNGCAGLLRRVRPSEFAYTIAMKGSTIAYTLGLTMPVTLEIFDVAGNRVWQTAPAHTSAGSYEVAFPEQQTDGAYIVQLRSSVFHINTLYLHVRR